MIKNIFVFILVCLFFPCNAYAWDNTEPPDVGVGDEYQELYDSLNEAKADLYNNAVDEDALGAHTAVGAAHHTVTVDTGPSPDCSGTTTYQDGEGGCDDISAVYEPLDATILKDADIGTTVQADLDVPSQAEAEAGVSTAERVWTAQRVSQAIAALAPGGVDEVVYLADCSGIINGFCIDTDDGKLYYWDNSSVVEVAASDLMQDLIDGDYGMVAHFRSDSEVCTGDGTGRAEVYALGLDVNHILCDDMGWLVELSGLGMTADLGLLSVGTAINISLSGLGMTAGLGSIAVTPYYISLAGLGMTAGTGNIDASAGVAVELSGLGMIAVIGALTAEVFDPIVFARIASGQGGRLNSSSNDPGDTYADVRDAATGDYSATLFASIQANDYAAYGDLSACTRNILEFDVSSISDSIVADTGTTFTFTTHTTTVVGTNAYGISASSHTWGSVDSSSFNDDGAAWMVSPVTASLQNTEYSVTLNAAALTALNTAITGNNQFKVFLRDYTYDMQNGTPSNNTRIEASARTPNADNTANYLTIVPQ